MTTKEEEEERKRRRKRGGEEERAKQEDCGMISRREKSIDLVRICLLPLLLLLPASSGSTDRVQDRMWSSPANPTNSKIRGFIVTLL